MGSKKLRAAAANAKKSAEAEAKKVSTSIRKKIPPTIALVYEALVELGNKSNGSTFKAIRKYISSKYGINVNCLSPACKQVMMQELNAGFIIQEGRKFLLSNQKDRSKYVKPRKTPQLKYEEEEEIGEKSDSAEEE